MSAFRLVVVISGRGSNLDSLIRYQRQGGYQIAAVISNRPQAAGLEIARQAGLDTAVLDHQSFENREQFDRELAALIDRRQPDLVVLAGFMRILGAEFVSRFEGRLINIHPSLLPQFPGIKTHERALQAGVQWHGASVHFVNAEVDGGPVIGQVRMRLRPDDDAASVADRLLPLEHRLLPRVVALMAEGRVSYAENKTCLDGAPCAEPLVLNVDADCWEPGRGDP
ncbi:MAG: phosphoribosylglycinamide formyltransferase [Xanthomonadales bacterium]|nr:phosphoribosylglycinamide formyltransferase [Xanthomonadales bacterium]